MIVLTVLSYNGQPGPQALSAQFDELGGTIGRADNNQLVLPDPERTISRVHARIVHRAGRWAIVDNGSNPISVNGRLLDAGREHPLVVGDELQIGGYLLKAAAAPTAAGDDPFGDLFGDAAMGLAAPATAPMPMQVLPQGPASKPSKPPQPWTPDPAAIPTTGSSWTAPARPSAPSPAAPSPPAAATPAAIPEDWDPFADDAPAGAPAAATATAPAAAGSSASDAVLGVSLGRSDSLDDLFGLGGLGGLAADADPLGAGPAQALQVRSNTATDADPLLALGKTATLLPASQADHGSELNTPMLLGAPAPRPAPAAAATPRGAIFSWDDPPREGRVVTLPGVRHKGPAAEGGPAVSPAPAALQADTPAPTPARPGTRPPVAPSTALLIAPSIAPPATMAPQPAATATPASAAAPARSDALLQALLDGLATPGLRLDSLDPDTLRLIGVLLRESTQGAVQLLGARAALKRELRAEMTMIVARENNPLKFSPTVEVALSHLLGPPAPGFMAPADAVRDAFDDLRAHQLGVMAGMRAALEGVLQRFDPQQLEGKLTHRSAISSLIPSTRKARLWELFQELFSQLQREAQDDFDELFGKAFLRAYEEQLDRLQAQRDADPKPR